MGSGPRPFRACGILDYLHRQLLADMNLLRLGQCLLDICRQAIANIHKGILARANIHKRRLHPRQDILHLPLVDIAHKMRMRSTLHLDRR